MIQDREGHQEILEPPATRDILVRLVLVANLDQLDHRVNLEHQALQARLFQDHQDSRGHLDLLDLRDYPVHSVTPVKQVIRSISVTLQYNVITRRRKGQRFRYLLYNVIFEYCMQYGALVVTLWTCYGALQIVVLLLLLLLLLFNPRYI